MQLFNKSQRIFAITGKRVAPQETFEVKEDEGKRLLKLYPNEIIEIKTQSVKATEPVVAKKTVKTPK